jgi:hypothetical protein
MRKLSIVALTAALFAACGPENVSYRPAPQILPSNIKRIAIRQVENKTQQFGLEDKFTLRVRDEFLRDGRYPIVPENEADGLVWITIGRYILTPIQYDARLVPTAYKLRIIIDLQFVDRTSNTTLREERNKEGTQHSMWDVLACDVTKRGVDWFGAVTGTSERRISTDAPSTAPAVQPAAPMAPVNPNTY